MLSPWLLLTLTLTLMVVHGGRAQPDVTQQEAATVTERSGLDDLLRQAERLLREDLQGLRTDQGERDAEPQTLQLDWLSKRQHPGKRDEEAEERAEEEEEKEGETQKRQHPGRRSSWLGYTVTKRQHPGRRLVDPKAPRSWEDEGELMLPEKRQHPGRRALGGPCGVGVACDQAAILFGILSDLSRSQRAEKKRQHPGRRATGGREPLEE
ncbi:PREDICTED: pro-thyrotropin-releasing hormone [Chrysochloris asiatica]|uniref:Pro-thyrotropin-releasing hormone n=1 Tax=Chrysochloris asiatica TaxID=185453 RepID=A0A9B0TPW5_CHRAS|nr:PREDICTED: pro-thyrotropin-releasing hormone [Chrysochloris asiatica]